MHQADTHLIEPLLEYLWRYQASDLHFSAGSAPRVRVDGRLVVIPEAQVFGADFIATVIRDLAPAELLPTFEAERQLDFAFSWRDTGRFRANAYYQSGTPALALRLIPQQIPSPEEVGLPPVVRDMVTRPHGLVLVTGPTGSGKSTTLASMVGWINKYRPAHILTIEDPIEYIHHSDVALVNQREVGPDCLSFADGLVAALREDPDVVLVGELRDLDTIAHTLTLAETGHLVFGTVHTNDAAQTIDRLIDVFPAEQQNQIRTQISLTLAAVISQRLVPRVGGGRVAAYEILVGNMAVSNLIREGKIRQVRNVISTGQKDGMVTLEQSLSQLVGAGVLTLEDARSVSVYPDEVLPGSPIPGVVPTAAGMPGHPGVDAMPQPVPGSAG